MARPKNDLVVIDQPAVDNEAVSADLVTFDQLNTHRSAAIAAVSEEFGVDLPAFDLDVYFNNINFLAEQAAEILMMQGIWLIALKQALPHGQFQEELAKRSRLSARSAQVLMNAARRLSTDGGKAFLANAKRDSHLSRTRLIELAINMPEEDLQALADDDATVDGFTREEYISMSRAELMAVLRDRDNAIMVGTAQNASLTTANKKLTAKQKREHAADPHGERVKKFEADMLDASGDAAQLIRKDLADIVTELHAARDAETDPLVLDAALEDRVTQAIRQAFDRNVAALRETALALGVDPAALGIASDEYNPAAL